MHQELMETRGFPRNSYQVGAVLQHTDYKLWSDALDVLAHGRDREDTYRRALGFINKQRVFLKAGVGIIYTVIEKNGRTTILLSEFRAGCGGLASGAGASVCIP